LPDFVYLKAEGAGEFLQLRDENEEQRWVWERMIALATETFFSLASLEVFANCHEKRCREIIEPKLDHAQCGCRPGCSI